MKLEKIFTEDQVRYYKHKVASKIVQYGDCLLWKGATSRDGYGKIRINRKTWGVHRLQYFLYSGVLEEMDKVRHSCDTPLCVNPDHLRVGSDLDNVRDMITRERAAFQRDPEKWKISQQLISTDTVLSAIHDVIAGGLKSEVAAAYNISKPSLDSFLQHVFNTSDVSLILDKVRFRGTTRKDAFNTKRDIALKALSENGGDVLAAAKAANCSRVSVASWAKERGINIPRKIKLTEELIEKIKNDFLSGMHKQEIAKKYGISLSSIYSALSRKSDPILC